MSENLKFSVLTPSFNASAYIENAIRSVLSQDYDNWEHIVVDGGSKDGTLDILKAYDHLQWVSEKDHGQSDAMNKAFQMASGDIIVYLNADDYFYPDCFAKIATFFQKNPEAEFVVTDLDIFNLNKDCLRSNTPALQLEDITDYRAYRFPLNPVSYFYKPSVQKKIGPFPISNHYAMDYWFLLRVYDQFSIHYHPITSGCFVMSDQNKSSFDNLLDAYQNLNKTLLEFLWEKKSAKLWRSSLPVLLTYEQMKWQQIMWKFRRKAGNLKRHLSPAS